MEGIHGEPITGAYRAYLDFYLGLRIGWSKLHAPLMRFYETRAVRWEQEHGRRPETNEEVGSMLEDTPLFKYFMWLQHNSQLLMKYGPYGTHECIEARRAELEAEMNRAVGDDRGTGPDSTIELNPDLEIPAYYKDTDYHLEWGGYWQDDLDGPAYDLGTRIHFSGEDNVRSIHNAKFDVFPNAAYRRILDLACGTGESTMSLAEAFPEAEVWGIDLAAPLLKWAHVRAQRRGLPIHFSQQNAERTTFESESFDLVTSSMFFHEIPTEAIFNVVGEAYRLLKPGGRAAFYTAGQLPTPYGQFMMDWHAYVNTEPYMPAFFRMDLEEPLRVAGFQEVKTLRVDAFKYGQPAAGSGSPPESERERELRLRRTGGWRVVTGEKR